MKFTFFVKGGAVLILINPGLLQQREMKGSDFRLVWLKNVLFPVSAVHVMLANDISFNRSQLLPRFINVPEYFFSICLYTKLHGCYAIKLCRPFYIFKQTPKLLMNPGTL